MSTTVTLTIPIEVVSESNQGKFNPWPQIRRAAKQKKKAFEYMRLGSGMFRGCHLKKPSARYAIILFRIKGRRQRDFDTDNLARAFKAIRDGISAALGIDDGSDRLQWEYRQEKGYKAAVRVEIRGME